MQIPFYADYRSSPLRRRLISVTACVFTSLLLVACGGGSASGDSRLDNALPETENNDSGDTSSSSSSSSSSASSETAPEENASSSSSSSEPEETSSSSSSTSTSESDATDTAVSSSSSSSSEAVEEPVEEELSEVSGAVELQWEAPQQRENGDYLELYEIGGYELRYRASGGSDYQSVQVSDQGPDVTYSFDNLEGSYEFTVAVYDNNGLYSEFVPLSPVTQ